MFQFNLFKKKKKHKLLVHSLRIPQVFYKKGSLF